MEFLKKLLLLPVWIVLSIFTAPLACIAAVRFRFETFFDGAGLTAHSIIFVIPMAVFALVEAVVLLPFLILGEIINACMEVFTILMVIPSVIVGFVAGIFMYMFAAIQYALLPAQHRYDVSISDLVLGSHKNKEE